MNASATATYSPQVDAYIAKAQPFAQPILTHLRDTIHRVLPEVEETIKWSMPFFLYRGVILANMAGHKSHASFGFWGQELAATLGASGVAAGATMGSLGRLTSLEDLPPTPELESHLRHAAALVQEGTRTKSIQRIAKPARDEAQLPQALAQALKTNQVAAEKFAGMSPSCRREYAEWIADAKREETRTKRIVTALEWITEGKGRNWKYEHPA